MKLETLHPLLPERIREDADTLWKEYRSRASGDVLAFAADLHERKIITGEELRDITSSGSVTVQLSESTTLRLRSRDIPQHRLLGLLGAGAMGEVHLAWDEHAHRAVALKRMVPELLRHPQLVERCHAEAQITAQLDHPGIVTVYGMEADAQGKLSYSMKLVRGRTLREILAQVRESYDQSGAPPPELDLPHRLDLFLSVCEAMDYAHDRGILHRDLKPDNIMVGAFHQVLVMDWGIAKQIGAAETSLAPDLFGTKANQTQTGTALGTPPYMSPEQAEGLNKELDARSDQYALGLILQEIVTLQRALPKGNALATLAKAADGFRQPMHAWHQAQRVPSDLVAIVDKACQLQPERRYASVGELADDVRAHLRDEPISAARDTLRKRVGRWVARHRTTTVMGVLALTASLLGVSVLGITGAFASLEYSRWQAEQRAQRLATVTAEVRRASTRLDGRFQDLEGLLEGLAEATSVVLGAPPTDQPVYLAEDFAAGRPGDMVYSPYYSSQLSLGHPDAVHASSVQLEAVLPTLQRLVGLGPTFERLYAQSWTQPGTAEQHTRMGLEEGFPLVWAYAATEDGAMVGYPGVGEYPEVYDPRERAWYTVNQGDHQVHWHAVDADESGMGLLITCSRAVLDDQGRFTGVAALDIGFGWVIDEYLDAAGLPEGSEAFLVDADGLVVVRSSQKTGSRKVEEYSPDPFPWPEHVTDLHSGSGSATLDDGQLLAWEPLSAVSWTYAVVVPQGAW